MKRDRARTTPQAPPPPSGFDAHRLTQLAYASLLAVAVLLTALFAGRWVQIQKEFAQASDRFGYLQMAADIRHGSAPHGLPRFTFDSPHARQMLAFLQQHGQAVENTGAAGPDGYHYVPTTNQIICQYPPGAGVMLSLLPPGAAVITWRMTAMGALALLGLWASLRTIRSGAPKLPAAVMVLAVTCGMCIIPLTTSFSVDLLLLPMAVVVLAALESRRGGWLGWALSALAGGMLGWAVVVRLAAVLFLPGILVAAAGGHGGGWRKGLVRLAVVTAAFALGVAPLLIHQHALTGGWLHATYTPVDAAPPSLHYVAANLAYYLAGDGSDLVYFLLVGLAAGALWIATWRRIDWQQSAWRLAAVLLWLLVPTAYFATHAIVTPYYQFPTLFVTLLGLAWLLRREGEKGGGEAAVAGWRRALRVPAAVGLLLFIFLQSAIFPSPDDRQVRASLKPDTTPPAALTDPAAWVLADRLSGTLWHYNGIAAVNPLALNGPTQTEFFAWLKARGEKVYIVEDNAPMAELMHRLNQAGIEFSLVGTYADLPEGTPFTKVYQVKWPG